MKGGLESQWKIHYISGLFYKHKVEYKYEMLCNAFGFNKNEVIPTIATHSAYSYCRSRRIPAYSFAI